MNARKPIFFNADLLTETGGQGRVITAFPARAGWCARFREDDGTTTLDPVMVAVVLGRYFEGGEVHCRMDGFLGDGQRLISQESNFMGFEWVKDTGAESTHEKPNAQACEARTVDKNLIAVEARNSLSSIRQILNGIITRVLGNGVLDGETGRVFKTRIIDSLGDLQEAERLLDRREGDQ